MATALELMGLGMAGLLAKAVGQAANASVTPTAPAAAGTATLITSPISTLATASAGGVILPQASGQPVYICYNNSGANQTVYPATGDTINGTTSVTLTSAKVGLMVPGQNGWLFLLGA